MTRTREGVRKVLVVDDDEQYLSLTARMLRSAGYEVVTRSAVIGTANAVLLEQPDIVLIDLNMPLISGDRLTPIIQRSTANPPLLVLYSGVEEKVLKQRARGCGADAVIPKGLPPQQFLQRVADLMGGAASARALRTPAG